jgi:hypothetical protein
MYGNKLSAGAGAGVVALVAFPPPVAFVGVGGVGCPVLSINEDIKPLAESVPVPVALVVVVVVTAGAVGCCVAVAFVVFVAVVSGGKPVGPGTVVVCWAMTGMKAEKDPTKNPNDNIKATAEEDLFMA